MPTQIDEICASIYHDSSFLIQTLSVNNTSDFALKNVTNIHNLLGLFIVNFCKEMPAKLIKLQLENERANIIKSVYPCLLILGISGNLLSFLVMAKISKRGVQKFSTSLAVLAAADIGILMFGCSREYVEVLFEISILSYNVYTCKIIYFLCYLFSSFSAYLHAFIAFERWNAVTHPFKSKYCWTSSINRNTLILIFCVCILFNLPLFWFSSLNEIIEIDELSPIGVGNKKVCQVNNNDVLFSIALTSIDTVFYCLLPFIITTVLSSLSLYKIIKTNRHRRSNSAGIENLKSVSIATLTKKSGHQLVVIENSMALTKLSARSSHMDKREVPLNESLISAHVKNVKNQNRANNLKITLMLLAIPLSYLITSFPIFVILIHGSLARIFSQADSLKTSYSFNTAYTIGTILMYIDNSINILFYIVIGKNMRGDFLSVLPLNIMNSIFNKNRKNMCDKSRCHNKSLPKASSFV